MIKFKTDNISIQGYSHVLVNKECQDCSESWSENSFSGVIVCDGHGGEKYIRSSKGSNFACEIGKQTITEFMNTFCQRNIRSKSNIEKQLSQLEGTIIFRWREKVNEDLTSFPLQDDERFIALSEGDKKTLEKNPVKAYGTTFIAAVLTNEYYFILKLGDGNVNVLYANNSIESPAELRDDQLEFNMTTSLCGSEPDKDFKHVFNYIDNKNTVKGIILTTDGIVNCFHSIESYNSLIYNIFEAYSETKNEKEKIQARTELEEGLHQFSEKGSGDDLSVAIIVK